MIPTRIAILTDSCADVPREIAREKNIFMVPLRILCEDGEHEDGVDFGGAEVCQKLRSGELPKTSLPSPEAFETVMKEIIAGGFDGVIAIMMSSGISGTYNLARLMAEDYKDRVQIKVYNSLSTSLGEGMVALQIAEEIATGVAWQELTERRVPKLIQDTYALLAVDTLEYLQKGGRIGKITALAGTLLNIKPILGFAEDGQLFSVAKVRGQRQAMQQMVNLIVARCGTHRRYNLAVANRDAPEAMETLRLMLTEALPNYDQIWSGELSGTVTTYVGDGMIGAAIQTLD